MFSSSDWLTIWAFFLLLQFFFLCQWIRHWRGSLEHKKWERKNQFAILLCEFSSFFSFLYFLFCLLSEYPWRYCCEWRRLLKVKSVERRKINALESRQLFRWSWKEPEEPEEFWGWERVESLFFMIFIYFFIICQKRSFVFSGFMNFWSILLCCDIQNIFHEISSVKVEIFMDFNHMIPSSEESNQFIKYQWSSQECKYFHLNVLSYGSVLSWELWNCFRALKNNKWHYIKFQWVWKSENTRKWFEFSSNFHPRHSITSFNCLECWVLYFQL